MKKIIFGITGLTLGGAERVLVDLANCLCQTYDITIFTIYAKGELEKELDSKIKLKSLCTVSYSDLSNFQKHILMPLKVLIQKNKIYKNIIKEKYEAEIAFLEGPITRLFSCKNKETKKIAWIHNDISSVFGNGIKAKLKKKIDEKIYSKYENLVFVSKENLKNFNQIYPNVKAKKEVIYNYLEPSKILKKSEKIKEDLYNKKEINLVTVARLVPQKAIDRLINVHYKLIKEGKKHHIYVIGDGPEKEKLEKQINEKQVQNTFTLLGKKENPYPYIKQADYFCLLSYFEGYGMVLEEAKILGKTIIITDTAAREAIENYDNSYVTENSEEGIYKILNKVLNNPKELATNKVTKKQQENEKIIEKVKRLIEE